MTYKSLATKLKRKCKFLYPHFKAGEIGYIILALKRLNMLEKTIKKAGAPCL